MRVGPRRPWSASARTPCAARLAKVQMEVNAVGRVIRELDRTEGQAGDNVTLSIDMGLQKQVAGPARRTRARPPW